MDEIKSTLGLVVILLAYLIYRLHGVTSSLARIRSVLEQQSKMLSRLYMDRVNEDTDRELQEIVAEEKERRGKAL